MFNELAPYLRQRAVLLTVTHLGEDQIRVNIIPQKLKDGDNNALTTPLSVTGTAEELDRELPATIVDFVAAHLQLKNTLDKAKAEMDEAAKAAVAEASAKRKAAGKKEPAKQETTLKSEPVTPVKPEVPKPFSLFDEPTPGAVAPATDPVDEENEILSEAGRDEDDEGNDELDEAA
jgi:PRTRC genetic system protein E